MEQIRLERMAAELGVSEERILFGTEGGPVNVDTLRRADGQIIRRLEGVEAQLRATEHALADLASGVRQLLDRLEDLVLEGPPGVPPAQPVKGRQPRASKRTSAATRPTETPQAGA